MTWSIVYNIIVLIHLAQQNISSFMFIRGIVKNTAEGDTYSGEPLE